MPSVQFGMTLPLDLYQWIESQATTQKIKKGPFVRKILDEERKREVI